jgi:hypothetical protein
LGESTSGNHVYIDAGHFMENEYESLDLISFKLENGLTKLIASLRAKKDEDWNDSFLARETGANYQVNGSDINDIDRWILWNQILGHDSQIEV